MLFAVIWLVTLLCVRSAPTDLIHNAASTDRIADEYLIVLHEIHTDRVAHRLKHVNVDEVIAKLKAISEEIEVLEKFMALKPPILHVRVSNEDLVKKAFQLNEVKLIEANGAHFKAQRCGSQRTWSEYWGLSRIAGPHSGILDYSYQPADGFRARAYILDSGIFPNHTFFLRRVEFGANTIGGNDEDSNGHGTFSAGIAIGTVSGVARGAKAVAVKVLDDNGVGSTSSVIAGVNWVIENLESVGGRGVISMSLSGAPSEALDTAVESAVDANIPVVIAAGNMNSDTCNFSPARSSKAITVAATNIDDELAAFSNWGSCVDILAPGAGIKSAGTCSRCVRVEDGTSASAAFVAGDVAILLSQFPFQDPASIKNLLNERATQGYIDLRGHEETPNSLLNEYCQNF